MSLIYRIFYAFLSPCMVSGCLNYQGLAASSMSGRILPTEQGWHMSELPPNICHVRPDTANWAGMTHVRTACQYLPCPARYCQLSRDDTCPNCLTIFVMSGRILPTEQGWHMSELPANICYVRPNIANWTWYMVEQLPLFNSQLPKTAKSFVCNVT